MLKEGMVLRARWPPRKIIGVDRNQGGQKVCQVTGNEPKVTGNGSEEITKKPKMNQKLPEVIGNKR